jgi:MFS family permease
LLSKKFLGAQLVIKGAAAEPLGPTFNKLWAASFGSNFADGLLKTAAPLLAASLTRDPVIISLLAALVMLPWLLFAIPIGGLVDRVNRRYLLASANALRFASAAFLALAVSLEFITIPLLYLAAFSFGIGEVIYDTTAQAMIPQVLKHEHLERGNARLEVTAVTVGEFAGAPISGLLYATAIGLPFLLGSFSILVAVGLVLMIPANFAADLNRTTEPAPEKTRFWADIRFGIRYLYEDKTLLKLVLLTASVGFFFSTTGSTVVLFLTETLGVSPAFFGFVIAAPAFGAIIGSLLASRFSTRFGRTTVMAAVLVFSSLMTALQGLSPNVWVFMALMLLGAIAVTIWNILLMSTYHQIIPNHLFGRIHGTRRTLVWGLMPIGAVLGGFIAIIDLRLPFLVGGAICLLISLLAIGFIRRLSDLLPQRS